MNQEQKIQRISSLELEALQDFVNGEFDLDAMETARNWIRKLLNEIEILREQLASERGTT